jgi:hypothetical protein
VPAPGAFPQGEPSPEALALAAAPASLETSPDTPRGIPQRSFRVSRIRWGIIAIGLVWCSILTALWLVAANPVIVNRTQLMHAEAVVLGTWQQPGSDQFRVERSWKRDLAGKTLSIEAAGPAAKLTGPLIIPISHASEVVYRITQGPLVNLPRDPLVEPMPAFVRPLVYPATAEVIAQIEEQVATATLPAP